MAFKLNLEKEHNKFIESVKSGKISIETLLEKIKSDDTLVAFAVKNPDVLRLKNARGWTVAHQIATRIQQTNDLPDSLAEALLSMCLAIYIALGIILVKA